MNALRMAWKEGRVMEIDRMYITEKEVSLFTGLSLSLLRNSRFNRKGIPYVKVGRSVRYKYSDVTNFMEARMVKTEPI